MSIRKYDQILEYLYTQLPVYHKDGEKAIKKDLRNIKALCASLKNPQESFPSIHIAGTNGKGTVTHYLAAILQSAGLRVGYYTSPHYIDFRERIKVNGQLITESKVIEFIEKHKARWSSLSPSFFEITVAMAFYHFREENVDIAIIETGLGGRLDSTNIIMPLLSVITNIGFDHQHMLGDSLPQIAGEKAGIIKKEVPVVIGDKHDETKSVFLRYALDKKAPLFFAEDCCVIQTNKSGQYHAKVIDRHFDFQPLDSQTDPFYADNICTVLTSIEVVRDVFPQISDEHIVNGITRMTALTKYIGRWQVINERPLAIADSGHNQHAWDKSISRLGQDVRDKIHFVVGFTKDKDPAAFFDLLPPNSELHLCRAKIFRSMPVEQLVEIAEARGLKPWVYPTVIEAYHGALTASKVDDLIFIGGSSFVVGDLLEQSMTVH